MRIDTAKITALSNHKPGILNNYIRIEFDLCIFVEKNGLQIWQHLPKGILGYKYRNQYRTRKDRQRNIKCLPLSNYFIQLYKFTYAMLKNMTKLHVAFYKL